VNNSEAQKRLGDLVNVVTWRIMMLRIIEGLPPQVLAIEAVGEVTHEDYSDVLIPRAEAMIAGGPVRMMYVVGAEFKNFDLEALWDDGAFGIKHWRDFSHVAVVTDIGWLRSAAGIFGTTRREGLDREGHDSSRPDLTVRRRANPPKAMSWACTSWAGPRTWQ
jgi:hypothetical protein